MKRCLPLLLLAVLASAGASEATANRICSIAAPKINALIDFAETVCAPGREGNGYSLMIITQQTAMRSEHQRKGYLLVVMGTVGKAMDDVHRGVGDIKRVTVMDRHLASQRKFVSIPAADLLRISRNARADKYDTLEKMYDALDRVAKTVDLPAKK